VKKIVILGAGGHALNVIDLLLKEQDEYEPMGILDPAAKGDVLGVPILGGDELLAKLRSDGIEYAFPAIGFGSEVNNGLRRQIYEKIKKCGYKLPNLISSKAFVRSGVKMGEGNIVQAGSVLDTEAELSSNIAVGFNVLIAHRCKIGSHVTFSGGVILNGGICIGEGTFLGMGCVLYRDVGSWCKISPGTVCMEAVSDRKIVFGYPARCIPNLQVDR